MGFMRSTRVRIAFLVRCNIPERLGLVGSTTLQTNFHGMLMGIPSVSTEGLGSTFGSIDSKLSAYENLPLLDLAVWKSKLQDKLTRTSTFSPLIMMMRCRIDSLSIVDFIVPRVQSFLYSTSERLSGALCTSLCEVLIPPEFLL